MYENKQKANIKNRISTGISCYTESKQINKQKQQ